MKKVHTLLLVAMSGLMAGSCTSPDLETRRTANTAIIGAGAGAIIGNNTSFGSVEGAIAGAVIGGLLGEVSNSRSRSSSSVSSNRYSRENNQQFRFR